MIKTSTLWIINEWSKLYMHELWCNKVIRNHVMHNSSMQPCIQLVKVNGSSHNNYYKKTRRCECLDFEKRGWHKSFFYQWWVLPTHPYLLHIYSVHTAAECPKRNTHSTTPFSANSACVMRVALLRTCGLPVAASCFRAVRSSSLPLGDLGPAWPIIMRFYQSRNQIVMQQAEREVWAAVLVA